MDVNSDCYVTKKNGKRSISVDDGGVPVNIDIPGAKTAFGEVSVASFEAQTGWIFPYNINPAIVSSTLLNGGTVSHSGAFAQIETGTDPNAVAFIRSNRALTYSPGVSAMARFTAIFDTPQPDSQQLIGVINNQDGLAFGYHGTQFGILRRRNGVDYWTYQSEWSENVKEDLIPQKGNVYQIKFQWLGFGPIKFYMENDAGELEEVHIIEYSNKNDDVSIGNPSLPLAAGVANTGNTTNITLKTPSAVAGLEGQAFTPVFESLIAYEQIALSLSAGEQYLFGVRNPDQYQGKDNRLYVFPRLFSAAVEGNKPVVIRVYQNPTIAAPVWNDIQSGISPLQVDTVGNLTVGSGIEVFSLPLGSSESQVVDLRIIDAEVQPRQTYAITVDPVGISDVVVAITFKSRT